MFILQLSGVIAGKESIRLDIQLLRCVAVLAVVVNHLDWDLLPLNGGFRGVDVFFVISGYVITTSILRLQRSGIDFSLSQFLLRRVRRLFPAVFVTAIAVSIVSLITQSYINVQQGTARSGIASVFFVINYWFARKHEGYFDPSYPNPLSHLWSLSVEEQFYLVLGLFFFAANKAKIKLNSAFVTTALFIFGAASLMVGLMPQLLPSFDRAPFFFADKLLSFYSLHTRAFQLIAGVLLAMFVSQKESFRLDIDKKAKSVLTIISTLLLVFALSVDGNGNRITAVSLIAVVSTVVLIATNAYDSARLHRSAFGQVLIRIGDYSYVLYLVHWPVIIYGQTLFGESIKVYVAEVFVMLALTLLVGKYVEHRLSIDRVHRAKTVWIAFGVGQALVVSAMAVLLAVGNHQQVTVRGGVVAWKNIDQRCNQITGACDMKTPGSTKSIVLEGDSYAAAFLNSFVNVASEQGLNIRSFPTEGQNLATVWNTEFGNSENWTVVSIFKSSDWVNSEVARYRIHLRALATTPGVSKVVVFLDNPTIPNWRAPSLFMYPEGISRVEAESMRSADLQRVLVQLIDEGLPITVLDPFNYVCTDTWCPTRINGRDLYFDNNHLTIEAAARLETEFRKQLSASNS
jgi:peptidoglycan/LPS O-acetylase OafA/YrhL